MNSQEKTKDRRILAINIRNSPHHRNAYIFRKFILKIQVSTDWMLQNNHINSGVLDK